MKFYCRYHPITAARWHCPKCRIAFCRACVPLADERTREGVCPHCRESLQFLRERRVDTPFWQNNSRFYRFPFQPEPALLLMLNALIGSVAAVNSITLGLAACLTLLLSLRYGLAISNHFAQGKLQAPSLQTIVSGKGYRATLALLLAVLVLVAPPSLAIWLDNPVNALILTLLSLLSAPALIISVLRQQDLLAALHPTILLAPIVRLGWAYLITCAHVGLCLLIGNIVRDLFFLHTTPAFGFAASAVMVSYACMVLAALFGYTLCQYQAGASETTESGQDDAASMPRNQAQALQTQALIDMALKDGRLDTLISLLKAEMKQKCVSDLRRDQLYFLLSQREDFDALLEDAEIYLQRLLMRGRAQDAFRLIRQLRAHDSSFRLYNAELSLQLAEQARKTGDFRLVLWLAQDAHLRLKPEPALARLYLLTATVLANEFNAAPKAAVFVDYVHTHLSTHLPSSPSKSG
jgi:hypothetical protein